MWEAVDMLILRLAVVSALIYVGFAVAIEVWVSVTVKMGNAVTITASKAGWYVLFGIFWLISFSIAFRLSPLFGLLRGVK